MGKGLVGGYYTNNERYDTLQLYNCFIEYIKNYVYIYESKYWLANRLHNISIRF